MSSIRYAHSTYQLVIEPHVETAIWAVALALFLCVIVMLMDESAKRRNAAPTPTTRDQPKKPRRRR